MYPMSMTDMRLIDSKISPTWCQRQVVRSNATFNAFVVPSQPSLTDQLVPVSMTRQLELEDDMKEYWGFYLLRGSAVTVSACVRWPGASLIMIKGYKHLQNCAYIGDDSSEELDELLDAHALGLLSNDTLLEKIRELKKVDGKANDPETMKRHKAGVKFHDPSIKANATSPDPVPAADVTDHDPQELKQILEHLHALRQAQKDESLKYYQPPSHLMSLPALHRHRDTNVDRDERRWLSFKDIDGNSEQNNNKRKNNTQKINVKTYNSEKEINDINRRPKIPVTDNNSNNILIVNKQLQNMTIEDVKENRKENAGIKTDEKSVNLEIVAPKTEDGNKKSEIVESKRNETNDNQDILPKADERLENSDILLPKVHVRNEASDIGLLKTDDKNGTPDIVVAKTEDTNDNSKVVVTETNYTPAGIAGEVIDNGNEASQSGDATSKEVFEDVLQKLQALGDRGKRVLVRLHETMGVKYQETKSHERIMSAVRGSDEELDRLRQVLVEAIDEEKSRTTRQQKRKDARNEARAKRELFLGQADLEKELNEDDEPRNYAAEEDLEPDGFAEHHVHLNETTAFDMSNSEFWSSFSSSEEALLECEGLILNLPLTPHSSCHKEATDGDTIAAARANALTYRVPANGYYFFVFNSENEVQKNYIRARFDLQKTRYDVARTTLRECTNSTDRCDLTLDIFSSQKVVLEVPLRNNDSLWNEQFVIISECEPRTSIYLFCVISVPILILIFAFQ
ncbi:uncharacterized protein LOC126377520 isoform X2 [Pectinophora gossypiella]|nr:uncharacterized protein LOC126377520 isoform X2 [Pectinophora gossypiella]